MTNDALWEDKPEAFPEAAGGSLADVDS